MSAQRAPGEPEGMSAADAAAVLGVRLETVYAYVSRGRLRRVSVLEDGRRVSRLDRGQVLALAAERSRHRAGTLEVHVESAVTRLTPEGELSYRGERAVDLARSASFEDVAALLWRVRPPRRAWSLTAEQDAAVTAVVAALHSGATDLDCIRAAVLATAALDEHRDDLGPEHLAIVGAQTVAAGIRALSISHPGAAGAHSDPAPLARHGPAPLAGHGPAPLAGHGPVAERVAAVLSMPHPRPSAAPAAPTAPAARTAPGVRTASAETSGWRALSTPPDTVSAEAVRAALVLLADHELAASTLAVRVAAGTLVDPWAVVGTGLAAVGGRLHGAVGARVELALETLVAEADSSRWERPGDLDARLEQLRMDGRLPGFGHKVYLGTDPRAEVLLDLVRELAGEPTSHAARVWPVLERLTLHAARRGDGAPNVDLGLAALVLSLGLRPGSSTTLFALARVAGWVAHAAEEYPEGLRFRGTAIFRGGY